jgi:putative flippase GtrA
MRPVRVKAVGAVRWGLLVRWMKFNAVGALGIVVQLLALAVLGRVLKLPVAAATGLAVETAIVHNFIWHRGWTWADRKGRGRSGPAAEALRVLLRFNLTTGLVSLLGNMLLMHWLVDVARFGLLRSNLLTIAMCSLMNFIVSDRFVFTTRR